MATTEEAFACPICLDILKDPATLPCGHSYCLLCIQKHWDQTAKKGSYECPQCRQHFKPRPVLARSNVLMEALEKLRLGRQDGPDSSVSESPEALSSSDPEGSSGAPASQTGLYPSLPSSSPQLCPIHQQVLELYCCDDKQCICDECSFLGHKGHQVVRPDEERLKIQQELKKVRDQIQGSIADRERLLQSLPQVSQAHKSSMQKMLMDSQAVFADVLRSVELSHSQVLELLQTHQKSASSRVETHTYSFQQEITSLKQKQEQLRTLDSIQDPVTFLNTFMAVGTVDQAGDAAMEIWSPESVISGVRRCLDAYRQATLNLTQTNLASIFRVVNDAAAQVHSSGQSCDGGPQLPSPNTVTEVKSESVKPDAKPKDRASSTATQEHPEKPACPSASPAEASASFCVSNPAPKTREEMLKFRIEPTLDHNSAFRHIRLSDGYRKATLCAEKQNYPDHPERFMFWRQVMCVEPLAGSPYYWELEWTGQRVTVGVAYKDMNRSAADDSARLGHNTQSWSLYWSGKAFSMWHDGKETALSAPKAKRIGVYLDQQSGVLAFYRVSHNQAQEICSVHTHFDRPLLPSFRFWSGVGSSISICELS
ncbi:finTRIM family, member 86 [Carassius auratus]|uniref:Tripartite motif-containing protein 65-like n=1 Tax=Carassius auratus TaxID=7957 RepID=A0A6P6R025_CARAU|nr:tripartite motif-containing protein 65-like [Carassius auratus]XP_026138769.1 tripartite motif-containing protein 65-like [Carassius auratus]